jgi:hypothetical protein
VRRGAFAALAAAALAGACATTPPPSPEASACLREAPKARRTSDYVQSLASYKTRAVFFASCMEGKGWQPDEDKIDAELRRIEQVRNADQRGGDPQLELRLKEQELRALPQYWRRAEG